MPEAEHPDRNGVQRHPPSNRTEASDEESSGEHVGFLARSFSGPLPPPEVLREYAELVPDAPERFLAMAERQAAHRQHLETLVVQSGIVRSRRGQACAFVIAIAGIGASTAIALSGHAVEGVAFGALDLAALVSVFIYGSERRKDERTRRAEIMTGERTSKS